MKVLETLKKSHHSRMKSYHSGDAFQSEFKNTIDIERFDLSKIGGVKRSNSYRDGSETDKIYFSKQLA